MDGKLVWADMATITTVAAVAAAAEAAQSRGGTLYLRWSAGPTIDALSCFISRNMQTRTPERGLSAMEVTAAHLADECTFYGLWHRSQMLYEQVRSEHGPHPRRAWLLQGVEIGRCPDDEPLLDPAQIVPIAWLSYVPPLKDLEETLRRITL